MCVIYGGFFLFIFILGLIVFFHLFWWNFYGVSMGGLRSWVSPFECGFLSQPIVESYFSYTYFILLVFFVIFDLEISLLLNLPLQGVLFKNMVSYQFFLALLCLGFWAEVNKGYVSWSY